MSQLIPFNSQFLGLLITLMALAMPSVAGADSLRVRVTVPSVNTSPGSGGPYSVSISPYPPNSSFLTFCTERGETFVPGTEYVGVISDYAVFGANGSQSGSDKLESQSAYLYSHFRAGDLTSLLPAFNANTLSHLQALQAAIWSFEGESVSLSSMALGLKSLALANATSGSTYNVKVLQLWDIDNRPGHAFDDYVGVAGHQHQDQLILTPLPTSANAGLGLIAVLAVVRRCFAHCGVTVS